MILSGSAVHSVRPTYLLLLGSWVIVSDEQWGRDDVDWSSGGLVGMSWRERSGESGGRA